jgi:hypothetical protein
MARQGWAGPGGKLRAGPLNALVRYLGGSCKSARHFGISRSKFYYWRQGRRPIPLAAIAEMERLLPEIERELSDLTRYLPEARRRAEEAERRWRERLYRTNRRRRGDADPEAGLPGEREE